MLNNSLEIHLITSKKSGVLAPLMNKLGELGLIYRRCVTADYDEGAKLTLHCIVGSNPDEAFIIRSLESMPQVVCVISVTQSKAGPNDVFDSLPKRFEQAMATFRLCVDDEITHDVRYIVEDRLSESLGPVANILLKSAIKKSNNVGELFLCLSNELSESQKAHFLKDVDGITS